MHIVAITFFIKIHVKYTEKEVPKIEEGRHYISQARMRVYVIKQ
jgi:hypothetical protein